MRPFHGILTVVIAATTFLWPASPAWAVWPVNPTVNVPVVVAPGPQIGPLDIAPDSVGGVFVTWIDVSTGLYTLYANHVLGSGQLDPDWPATGVIPFEILGYDQNIPRLIPDDEGGVFVFGIVILGDYFLAAQHLSPDGTPAPGWPVTGFAIASGVSNSGYDAGFESDGAGGALVVWSETPGSTGRDVYAEHVQGAGPVWGAVLVCNAANNQRSPLPVPDLAGGAVVVWIDERTSTDGDLYAHHVRPDGTLDPGWPTNGRALCTASSYQRDVVAETDGAGGAFVAWRDYRSGAWDLYMHHVLANGSVDPAWPTNGLLVMQGINTSTAPALTTDGAGGALVAARDSVMEVNHVLSNGAIDPAWPGGGLRLTGRALSNPSAIPDGLGGLILVTEETTPGLDVDISADHVLANGILDPTWPGGGAALCTDPTPQSYSVATTDGAGGAIAAWMDVRNYAVTEYDIYAQRVQASGVLGIPEPHIVSAEDIPGDEGGRLLLAWEASEGDALINPYVTDYQIWRMLDDPAAAARSAGAAAVGACPRPGEVRARMTGATTTWWEFIATVPAVRLSHYAYMVATPSDSMPGSIPWNVFIVDAEDGDHWAFYSSPPDSGYSVDNLAPGAPAPFTGAYAAAATHLHWNPNGEPDLSGYRLYRGATADFVPDAGHLIAAPADTGFVDPGPAGRYYKLSAVDVHTNEGVHSLLGPDGTVDVDPVPDALAFGLEPPQPNPMRGDRLAVTFVLPVASAARLDLLDVSGRRIATRDLASLGAGRHGVNLSPHRRLAPGLYFVRLTQGRAVRMERVIVLE